MSVVPECQAERGVQDHKCPIQNGESAEEELNVFLRSYTVLSVDRRWVDQGSHSFWSFCIDYLDPGIGSAKGSQRSQPATEGGLPYDPFASPFKCQ